jgi:hypothetical protein
MKRALPCTVLALFAWGCSGDGSGPKVATSVVVTPPSVTLDAVGATQVVRASVKDQNGGTMSGVSISWSSSTTAATVVGAGGDSAVVTAAANGTASITATAGAANGSAAVQVAQVASALQKVAGDLQTGAVGTALPGVIRVKAVDRLGAPVAGQTVTFAVMAGGGTLSSTSVVSGADGNASTIWTLGTSATTAQTVSATLSSLTTPIVFNATPVAGPAAAVTVFSGAGTQVAGIGAAVSAPPAVRVTDAFGNAVSGATVVFTVTSGGGSVAGGTQFTNDIGVATVGSWTLGPVVGDNTLTATVQGTALAPIVFNATAIAGAGATVAMNAGHNQGAMVSTALPTSPSVIVRDGSGNPLAGRTVTFAVTAGGGSVTGPTATTDASGVATVGSWILGPIAGPNALTATVSGGGVIDNPVIFGAIGCQGGGGAGYAITLCFTSNMTLSQRTVFESAAARWASVITADVANVSAQIPSGSCGDASPSLNMTFDDLLIFASVEDIDGPGAILGQAGWCYRRTGSLPVIGLMRFDAADVASLEANGGLGAVFLHEMGHVLGIGSMWTTLGLLQNPTPSSGGALDTYFSGAGAIAGFDAIGGSTYTGGQKVPVENTGGQGTANSHWRESVLQNELMTGYLGAGVNPLSVLTVRSLADLGYTVNTAAADPFFLTLSVRAPGSTAPVGLRLHNDLWQGPQYNIDRQGRRTRLNR